MNTGGVQLDKQELIRFEQEIAEAFPNIRAPVHFSGGNEDNLIEIFKEIRPEDWVFSTHRSHYHALLKGIPKEWVKQEILKKNSIHLMNKEYKFFTSSIVGGILPIALGVAMAIKRNNGSEKVWAFIGDMARETGVYHECAKYASSFDLPLKIVVEDNLLSVNTPTMTVWGVRGIGNEYCYFYTPTYPHQGIKNNVLFR